MTFLVHRETFCVCVAIVVAMQKLIFLWQMHWTLQGFILIPSTDTGWEIYSVHCTCTGIVEKCQRWQQTSVWVTVKKARLRISHYIFADKLNIIPKFRKIQNPDILPSQAVQIKDTRPVFPLYSGPSPMLDSIEYFPNIILSASNQYFL